MRTIFILCLLSLSAQADPVNVALNKPVTFSSDNAPYLGALVNDGNQTTRWSSQYSDPQFISVDLQDVFDVSGVCLFWENAYSSNFTIEASLDNQNWTAIYVNASNNSQSTCTNSPVQTRYVRMNSAGRATGYGNSIWEFEVYGVLHSAPPPPNPFVLDRPACYADDKDESKEWNVFPPRLIIAWYCDRPGGIQGYVRVYTFADSIRAFQTRIANAPAKDQKQLVDALVTTRELTVDEQSAADIFLASVRPTAAVSLLNGATTRPVYTAKTDRSVGPNMKVRNSSGVVVNLTIPIGSECKYNDRLVSWDTAHTVAVGTNYYALKDVVDGYAICTVTGKISK